MGKKKGAKSYDDPPAFDERDEDEVPDIIDEFASSVDALLEKRASTREQALQRLVNFLRAGLRSSECTKNESTLLSRCKDSLRKGGSTEATAAATLVGLHLLTLESAPTNLPAFCSMKDELQRAISPSAGNSVEVRCAALDSLAVLCWTAVVGGEEEMVECVMERIHCCWGTGAGDPSVSITSMRCWAFLFTCRTKLPTPTQVESLLWELQGLLHSKHLEVRGSAGEVVALLYDTCGFGDLLEAAAYEQSDEEDEGSFAGMESEEAEEESESAGGGLSAAKDLAPEGSSEQTCGGSSGSDGGHSQQQGSNGADQACEQDRSEEMHFNILNGGGVVQTQQQQQQQHDRQHQRQPQQQQQQGVGGGEGVMLSRDTTTAVKRGPRSISSRTTASDASEALSAGLDDVVMRMQALAGNGRGDPQRRSRQQRSAMRSTFRSLVQGMESGIAAVRVKLPSGDVFSAESLSTITQLHFLRRFLASGFQVHLQHNPLLHYVWDFHPSESAPERLGSRAKRDTKSPNSAASKSQTANRKHGRASKVQASGTEWQGDDY